MYTNKLIKWTSQKLDSVWQAMKANKSKLVNIDTLPRNERQETNNKLKSIYFKVFRPNRLGISMFIC